MSARTRNYATFSGFALLCCWLVFLQCAHAEKPFTPLKPPGTFVNLGLHRMYIDCRGSREPTVLIDVGLGDASVNWMPVMLDVEPETRVCLYDRAGYGFSDTGPGYRTTAQIVHELHAVLELGNIPGPYVLVGHSFGGYTAQYFAIRYPKETVGVVLVDSSHPDQITRLAPLNKATKEQRKLFVSKTTPPPENMTPLQKEWYYLNISRKATFAQMDELKYFSESAREVKNAGSFPDIPLAVLTRGKTLLPVIDGVSMEKVWIDMQNDLAKLSPQSWHVFVKNSGHNIYHDAPETVAENIIKVAQLARINMARRGEQNLTAHNSATTSSPVLSH